MEDSSLVVIGQLRALNL